MAGTSRANNRLIFPRFVGFFKWFWDQRSVVIGTIIIGLLVSGFIAWLFVDPTTVPKLPVHWIYEHPYEVLFIFLFVALLFAFSWAVSRIPVEAPEHYVKREYLSRLSQDSELLTLSGVPAGLMARRVKLQDVYIQPRFRQIPPLKTYPLTAEEIAHFHRQRKQGIQVQEMDRLLIGIEGEWERNILQQYKVGMSDLWRDLTRKEPAAVIQGYPGMGKSTLLTRLTLYMAQRCLHKSDEAFPALTPPLLPILVSLKEFADQHKNRSDELSLLDFIKNDCVKKFNNSDLGAFIEKWLDDCECLVLLDGLDEVSDQDVRQVVQKAIREFIAEQRHPEKQMHTYNRFLITSRVAGYDLAAFPHYPHYFITELTTEQIRDFLPRWCRANVRRDLPEGEEAVVRREAEQVVTKLLEAIERNPGVRSLAENPLLLTLLAAMQQKGIELPRRRAKLYKVVTETLLEDRNIAKGLPQLPEAVAILRLGPLAFQMHARGNSFAREQDVLTFLEQAISSPQGGGGATAVIEQEARSYLERISERGGLFVRRTGDYYGFFHRTFEEYFAARYILKQLEFLRDKGVTYFVEMARREDALWREPFLLAVAHKSGEDSTLASQLTRTLLHSPQDADDTARLRDLLLATSCIIESEPATIDLALQQEVAERLVQSYEHAQQHQSFEDCEQIEAVVVSWILSLPGESYQPALPLILQEAIRDTAHLTHQQAVLTLLTMIGQKIAEGPSVVFDLLIPPMLALAGLSPTEKYQPSENLSKSPSLDIAVLALVALSSMAKRGPTGLSLGNVRQHFKSHPEQLRELARYSLESGTLLTLAVAPLQEEHLQLYITALNDWTQLLSQNHFAARDIDACVRILQTLLDCADEVCYPNNGHFLKMLEMTMSAPEQPWQQIWQRYLLDQLKLAAQKEDYINYRSTALLWASLFPSRTELKTLASVLIEDLNSGRIAAQRYARRVLAEKSGELQFLFYLIYTGEMRSLDSMRGFTGSGHWSFIKGQASVREISRAFNYARGLNDIIDRRYMLDVRDPRYLGYLVFLWELRYFGYLVFTRNQGYWDYAIQLYDLLFPQAVIEKAKSSFSSGDPEQSISFLRMLLGYIIRLDMEESSNDADEQDVQEIISRTSKLLSSQQNYLAHELMLDLLYYFPIRSANGVRSLLQLAEETTDLHIQATLLEVLRGVRSSNSEAWAALELGKQSKVETIRNSVEERLARGY